MYVYGGQYRVCFTPTIQALCLPKVGGGPCDHDDSHGGHYRSSRPHCVRKENGDHAVADTEPGTLDLTARHSNRGPEVLTDDAVFGPGRSCRRKRWHYARDQRTDSTRKGLLQSVQAGAKDRGDGHPALRVSDVDP